MMGPPPIVTLAILGVLVTYVGYQLSMTVANEPVLSAMVGMSLVGILWVAELLAKEIREEREGS